MPYKSKEERNARARARRAAGSAPRNKEYEREYGREYQRRRYAENPEFRAKKNATNRKRYAETLEVSRARAREASRKWREANPEEYRAVSHKSHLKRKYGMSEADVLAMVAAQGGGCAACGRTDFKGPRGRHVDHCHKTGVVRGVLCRGCNTSLGQMEDNPTAIRALADYVERTTPASDM